MLFKFHKNGRDAVHSEIKSIQYGVFITLGNDNWEFRTIDEVNQMKDEMDKQMKELLEKTVQSKSEP